MNRNQLIFFACLMPCSYGCAQVNTGAKTSEVASANVFTDIKQVGALPVINQHASGTCWAFSTTSFLESEILRIKGEPVDLSEMYFVRNAYIYKTRNYIMRQGTSRFTEGGCNHDPLLSLAEFGLQPQSAYTGHLNKDTIYDHRKLIKKLEPRVKAYANPSNKLGTAWKTEIPALLNEFIGKPADTFSFAGKLYTSLSFLAYTQVQVDNYVNLTSFTHAPFDKPFILNIPANWANATYYNLSLEEYMANIDHALENGYSLTVDLDISEPGFSFKRGIAVMDSSAVITSESRQLAFENFSTTDDHNMHIVGKARDQNGNVYYKCKNSWGTTLGVAGFFYLSASYIKMKSISVMLHKNGLLDSTRHKLQL